MTISPPQRRASNPYYFHPLAGSPGLVVVLSPAQYKPLLPHSTPSHKKPSADCTPSRDFFRPQTTTIFHSGKAPALKAKKRGGKKCSSRRTLLPASPSRLSVKIRVSS